MPNESDSTRPTDGDHVDDAYERLARDAGAALRRPAPTDGVARLRAARRRKQMVRTTIAGGTTAIIVVVGLVAISRRSDQTIAPSDTATASTSASTTSPTSTTIVVPTTTIPHSLEYTFTGIDGLVATNEPGSATLANATGATLIIAWSATTGVADGFVLLYETRGSTGATEPEGDVTSVPIDVPDGHAYLVTGNDADGQPMTLPSATRVMWWRDDGRLWIVSNYDVAPSRLTQLTLAIQPGSGLPYVLPEAGTSLVGFNAPEAYDSVTQVWSLDGSTLVLGVSTGGLVQQLADTTIVSVVKHTIAGMPGYAFTLPNGQVNLTWPTDNADRWGSLIVSPPLADRVDEIAAAITPI